MGSGILAVYTEADEGVASNITTRTTTKNTKGYAEAHEGSWDIE